MGQDSEGAHDPERAKLAERLQKRAELINQEFQHAKERRARITGRDTPQIRLEERELPTTEVPANAASMPAENLPQTDLPAHLMQLDTTTTGAAADEFLQRDFPAAAGVSPEGTAENDTRLRETITPVEVSAAGDTKFRQ